MGTPLTILIVEDNLRDADIILDALRRYGSSPDYKRVENIQALNVEIDSRPWDLILCSHNLSQANSIEMLRVIRDINKRSIPLIFLFDSISEEDAANLISFGAHDCLPKKNFHRLVVSIKRGLIAAEARRKEGQIESSLETERYLLRQLMSNIPDTIAFKDLQGRYTHVNKTTCAMFDRSENQILGRTREELDLFPESSFMRSIEEKIIATGEPVSDQIDKIMQPDGTARWISSTKAPIRDNHDKITGLVVIGRDITERIRDEEKRLNAAKRFRNVIDMAVDGIISIDENMCITVFNKAAEKIFGYQTRELIGQPLDVLLPPSEAANLHRCVDKFRNSPDLVLDMSKRRPVSGRRKNGKEFSAELSVSKFVENGKINFIAIVRDITDRLQLEERLIQSQKMEAVGQLTGGVAHDFNNLLMVVIGNLDILKEMAGSDATVKGLIDDALAAAVSGADLSKSLLTFSRRQTLNPEQIDVNALVLDHVNLIKRSLGGVTSVETIIPDDTFRTTADPVQLRCVLTNLALNARDAMPAGGTLTLRTYGAVLGDNDVQEHDGLKPGDYVVIEVSDTGVGISPELFPRIFEPFFTTKEVGKGTGLGLSMVYGFIKQSNGKVSVSSEVGRGTTISLYLPSAEKISNAAETAPVTKPALANEGETILVVDDDAHVRKVVIAQLTALGYKIIEAASPSEALKVIAGKESIDLLFTDIVMPGNVSGVELAQMARQQRRDLKVLLTSGFPDLKTNHDSGSITKNAIIKKPYRRSELQHALREVLGGGIMSSPH